MKRTDTHSPSNFEPAEYTLAGFVDLHATDGFEDIEDPRVNELPYWRETVERYNGCDHCGTSGQRYIVLFIHEPSQQVVITGTQCAERLALASRAELRMKDRRKAAERRAKYETWLAASPDNAKLMDALRARFDLENAYHQAMSDWIDRDDSYHLAGTKNPEPQPRPPHRHNGFLADLLHKANRYGSLSEKQVSAGLAAIERDAEFAAKREAEDAEVTADFPSGRVTIQGTCLSTRTDEGFYGTTFKWLVKLDDGNKVWGTVPSSIDAPPKGRRVEFTARFEVSPDDPHFGFYKNPTKCRFLDEDSGEEAA